MWIRNGGKARTGKGTVVYRLEFVGICEFGETKAAGLFCKDGELFLQFKFCPCPMLAEVDRLETNTWCQCTTGYSKVLFEKAFACDVDVELLKSAVKCTCRHVCLAGCLRK